jgi:hypothetical protein
LPLVPFDTDPRQRHDIHSWRALLWTAVRSRFRQLRFLSSCLNTNIQRKILHRRAKAVRPLARIDSITDADKASATPLRCDVQFVPICNDVACSLNVEFRQSINGLLQCMSLCLKIRMNLLDADSGSCITATKLRFLSQPKNHAVIPFKL